jgi:hypothetical protein
MFATSSQIVYVSFWSSTFAVLRRLDIDFSNPPTCESDREFKSDVWNKTSQTFVTLNDTFSVPPSQNYTIFPMVADYPRLTKNVTKFTKSQSNFYIDRKVLRFQFRPEIPL